MQQNCRGQKEVVQLEKRNKGWWEKLKIDGKGRRHDEDDPGLYGGGGRDNEGNNNF